MQRKWVLAVAVMLMLTHLNALGDWKSELARTAVRSAARAGIQEAVEDAVKDRAFDATLGAVGSEAYAARRVTFGENAGTAVENAMTAADVAGTLDKASEAVEAAQEVNRARKVVKTRTFGSLMTAVALAGTLSAAAVQRTATARKSKWTATEVLPLTCAQAWVKSNKNYSGMLSIEVTLARASLANRNLTFPDTREAGLEAGKGIANDCKADPSALLFAIVDKHVRQVAEPSTNAGK